MFFNYGAFPRTWEDPAHISKDTHCKGDNDPIDCVEIGIKQSRVGDVIKVKVIGVLGMIDAGETDWKVIAIAQDDILADVIRDIEDVEKHMPGALPALREWLRMYKIAEGKSHNTFALEEKFMNAEYAKNIIQETHESWKDLTKVKGGKATV